jgi:amylosucrase
MTMDQKATLSLERLLPRLKQRFAQADSEVWEPFQARLEANFENLFSLLLHLYGRHYDFFYHLESILETAARMWLVRPPELKALDAQRCVT